MIEEEKISYNDLFATEMKHPGVWLSSPGKAILLNYPWNWNKWQGGMVLERVVFSKTRLMKKNSTQGSDFLRILVKLNTNADFCGRTSCTNLVTLPTNRFRAALWMFRYKFICSWFQRFQLDVVRAKKYFLSFCFLQKLCSTPQWRISQVSLQLVIVSVVDAGGTLLAWHTLVANFSGKGTSWIAATHLLFHQRVPCLFPICLVSLQQPRAF